MERVFYQHQLHGCVLNCEAAKTAKESSDRLAARIKTIQIGAREVFSGSVELDDDDDEGMNDTVLDDNSSLEEWEEIIAGDILDIMKNISIRLRKFPSFTGGIARYVTKTVAELPLHPFTFGSLFAIGSWKFIRTCRAHSKNDRDIRELQHLADQEPKLFGECMQALEHFQIFPESDGYHVIHFEEALALVRQNIAIKEEKEDL